MRRRATQTTKRSLGVHYCPPSSRLVVVHLLVYNKPPIYSAWWVITRERNLQLRSLTEVRGLAPFREQHPRYVLYRDITCAECNNSLMFSGAFSIPLCYIPFPLILFHQLVFHPPSLHHAIYFLVYLSALLLPNSYTILFLGILFSSILCTCPNQHNLLKLIVSVIMGFSTIA